MRNSRLLVALSLTIVALALAGWLAVSVGELHDKVARHSLALAVVVVVLAVIATSAAAMAAARMFWVLGRGEPPPAQAPEDIVQAAELQARGAETVIAQVQDEPLKTRLQGELAALRVDQHRRQFHVVVFGTGSAGKTSLINALLGDEIGATHPVMGTTQHKETHTHTVEGVEGTLLMTDTPGLSEIGAGGAVREAEARDLATRADLLLFVVDHDLIRTEYNLIVALARQGKRSIVVLNKKDRFLEADWRAVLAKLRERLASVVAPEDIVAIAAHPRPIPVRVRGSDGSEHTILEPEPPDLAALQERIAEILRREGDALRAGNLLLRAHLLAREAQDALSRQRREQAEAVIDKFQWITAGTVFTNPFPALDLLATGAVQFQMITEIAAVFGVELATTHVRMIGGQMVQLLLKLGIVETASSLISGLFKSTLVGYAAGGSVQMVTMAYLTHISGHTFIEYFARGQSWGDGGMQAALVRQFDLNSRAEFLQEFAQQALHRIVRRVGGSRDAETRATTPRG